jgi:Holliday junction resolvasome RuvABC endonuclease subunit
MNITNLNNTNEPTRVLGIDASTQALAFCLMNKDQGEWYPERWGKMDIVGNDVYERCGDINKKLYGLMGVLDPDHVELESVVFVNNRAVVIQLAKVVGAAIGVAHATGRTVSEVTPIAWMNYIGNPTRDSADVKKAVRADNPGKTKSWYKQELRRMRKQRTLDWVEQTYGIKLDDDDVGDSFGVAYYAIKERV